MALSAVFRIAALQLLAAGRAAAEDAPDGQCSAAGGCSPGVLKAPVSPYYWPMARGPIGSHSTSPYKGPRDLASSLKWSWDRPEGKYLGPNSNGAPLIDDRRNIYTMFGPIVHKFSPDGAVLWQHFVEGFANDIPALMDGVLYVTEHSGNVRAISMETGRLLWRASVCAWQERSPSRAHPECDCGRIGGDIGALAAHGGVVTFRSHRSPGDGACKAMGLNASTGEFLWDYAADHLIWNYYPILTEDGGSILFQDSTGTVYRLGLHDGREMWKAGQNSEGWYETWTDGGLQIGPNGVVYAVKALGGVNAGPGQISAYRIADGKHLWTYQPTREAPNAWPAIGRMRDGDPLTVVAPSGQAGGYAPPWEGWAQRFGGLWSSPLWEPVLRTAFRGLMSLHEALGDYAGALFRIPPGHPELWGLHAETGEVLWKHAFPPWLRGRFRGENQRMMARNGPCVPNPVGNPTLDSNGNLYLGMLDGFIYHFVRESGGPGVKVQSRYDAEGAFSNGGVSLAPGMMVIVSCDTLYVFRGEA